MPRGPTACDVASNSSRADEARRVAPEPSRTTTATTAARTRRRASSPAATAPVTRPQKHEHRVNVLLKIPFSNRFDPARAAGEGLATWWPTSGHDASTSYDQKAKKGCFGGCPTVSEGGRGARGTGSPDRPTISNPPVYARVPSWRKRWVPSRVVAGRCAWLWRGREGGRMGYQKHSIKASKASKTLAFGKRLFQCTNRATS